MKKLEKASAQVVEISFVLPAAMIVVLTLLYLAFGMFLYVHSNNLARSTLYSLSEKVGSSGMYWQLLGEYISEEDSKEENENLKKSLKGVSVLPGLSFDSGCSVTGKLRQPIASVYITGKYFGKEIFTIKKSKTIYKPAEFANTIDFGKNIVSDFDELKGIYDAIF